MGSAPSPIPRIGVEVVHAGPQRAVVKILYLSIPATVADALRLAAADSDFAEIDMAHAAVGIFGKIVGVAQTLEDGDRVEIYRPLAADPKSARRARAREGLGRNSNTPANRSGRS